MEHLKPILWVESRRLFCRKNRKRTILEIAFAKVPAPAAAGESIAIFKIFFLLIIYLNNL